MGLLDELQAEVDRIRDEEQARGAELEARQVTYEQQLRPAMLRAYEYFSKIAERLSIVAPDIHPSYPIHPTSSAGITLRQTGYRFTYDDARNPRQLDLHCHCELEQPWGIPAAHGSGRPALRGVAGGLQVCLSSQGSPR